MSTESLPPGYFDQQLQNILVKSDLLQQRNSQTITYKYPVDILILIFNQVDFVKTRKTEVSLQRIIFIF